MINILLYILLVVLSFLIASKILVSLKSDKYKKRNNLIYVTKDYSLKELFSKFNFLKTKENFLSKQGYPLNLNAISYYFSSSLAFLTTSSTVPQYKNACSGKSSYFPSIMAANDSTVCSTGT